MEKTRAHVFLLKQLPPATQAELSPSSQARWARFRNPQRQALFAASRVALAQAASQVCQRSILARQIVESPAGYPLLPAQDWQVSLSHSGPWLALAFAQTRIGIDVECITRARDWLAMAERALPAQEYAWVAANPVESESRFHQAWTLREAAFKAGLIDLVVGGTVLLDQEGKLRTTWGWHHQQDGSCYLSVVAPTQFEQIALEQIKPHNLPR